uniref:Uncharacterized protein n=1 Tax=Anguilla anguilla TaxID=7936 RepID=A0A0E9W4W9_ANGAN
MDALQPCSRMQKGSTLKHTIQILFRITAFTSQKCARSRLLKISESS